MAKLIITLDGVTISELVLHQPRVTVGRAATNDIHLDDSTVSGKHAVVHVLGNEVFIEDLESTNGTKVNGQRVHRRQLRHGDVLGIGKHELKFINDVTQDLQATVIIPAAQREALKSATKDQAGRLKILNGAKAGEWLELNKAYNTIGKPGVQVAVVAKRSHAFFLVPVAMAGGDAPLLNDKPVGAAGMELKNGDVLEVAGVRLEFRTQS